MDKVLFAVLALVFAGTLALPLQEMADPIIVDPWVQDPAKVSIS